MPRSSDTEIGICDLCDKQITPDASLEVVQINAETIPDHLTPAEAAEIMADTLRHSGAKYDELVAFAYRQYHSVKAHQQCFEQTSLPSLLGERLSE